MKNNKTWIIVAFIIIICVAIGIFFVFKNKDSGKSNYIATRTGTNEAQNVNNTSIKNDVLANNNFSGTNNMINENNSIVSESNNVMNNTVVSETPTVETPKKEEEISSFSTKIYTHDPARQNNIYITCSALTDTVVANGSTFSFCNTLGPSTSAKGYQEADIFDKNGNKKKGLGGGNCQVSTTLYNAVLKVSSLEVTERHEHSNKVPYIANGKDAAVAYGSYDFKFVNNSGYDIKIIASATNNNVSITLYKINF